MATGEVKNCITPFFFYFVQYLSYLALTSLKLATYGRLHFHLFYFFFLHEGIFHAEMPVSIPVSILVLCQLFLTQRGKLADEKLKLPNIFDTAPLLTHVFDTKKRLKMAIYQAITALYQAIIDDFWGSVSNCQKFLLFYIFFKIFNYMQNKKKSGFLTQTIF